MKFSCDDAVGRGFLPSQWKNFDSCHRLVLTFLCTLLLSLLKYHEALLTAHLWVLHHSLKSLDYNVAAVYLYCNLVSSVCRMFFL